MLKTKLQTSHLMIRLSVGLLAVFALVLICPIVPGDSHAEGEITRSVDSDVSVWAQSAVSVSLQSKLDIDIFPQSDSNYNSQNAELIVATNNTSGYTVYLRAADETGNLTNQEHPEAVIHPTSVPLVLDKFMSNTWGYNISSTAPTSDSIYSAIPTTDSFKVAESDQLTNRDTYNLSFGAKIDMGLPAGQYTNNVIVSVVANPIVATSLSQLTYMQDMTADICTTTPSETSKQLIDIRDGKSYWVEKMLNGRCWMTQDLAIEFKDFEDGQGMRSVQANGGPGAILNSSNTDLAENSLYQGMEATRNLTSTLSTSITSTRNFYFGKYVKVPATDHTRCDATGSGLTLSSCAKVGFVDVSDESLWQPTFQAGEGVWDNKTQYVTTQYRDPEHPDRGGVYDAHYLTGGYYTFNLATAGSGGTSTSGHAPYSICPKNWKLPLNDSGDGGISNLLAAYDITDKIGGATSADDNAKGYNANKLPLAFTLSGSINNNGFSQTGRGVYYWIGTRATASDSGFTTGAYFISIYDNTIGISTRMERYSPISVRCLVR